MLPPIGAKLANRTLRASPAKAGAQGPRALTRGYFWPLYPRFRGEGTSFQGAKLAPMGRSLEDGVKDHHALGKPDNVLDGLSDCGISSATLARQAATPVSFTGP